MTFRVGQKVACIKREAWRGGYGSETCPVFGGVYTVREVRYGGSHITLAEIINPPMIYNEGFMECDFPAVAFRPLVERKTDISIFKRMLKPQGVDA